MESDADDSDDDDSKDSNDSDDDDNDYNYNIRDDYRPPQLFLANSDSPLFMI